MPGAPRAGAVPRRRCSAPSRRKSRGGLPAAGGLVSALVEQEPPTTAGTGVLSRVVTTPVARPVALVCSPVLVWAKRAPGGSTRRGGSSGGTTRATAGPAAFGSVYAWMALQRAGLPVFRLVRRRLPTRVVLALRGWSHDLPMARRPTPAVGAQASAVGFVRLAKAPGVVLGTTPVRGVSKMARGGHGPVATGGCLAAKAGATDEGAFTLRRAGRRIVITYGRVRPSIAVGVSEPDPDELPTRRRPPI